MRFVSLILVRSRCGDSSAPQDTDFNDCVHEELDIDEVVSLILVRSRCGDSSTPQDTVGYDNRLRNASRRGLREEGVDRQS